MKGTVLDRVLLGCIAALSILSATGCAGPAASPTPSMPTESGMPSRPVDLSLSGVDPCALLTPDQRVQFGLRDSGTRRGDGDRFGSIGCLWGGSSLPPYGGPLVKLVVAQGVQYYVRPDQQPTIVSISGFPALQTNGAYADPETGCLVLVDIGPGQTLWTQYSNEVPRDRSGINNKIACEKARETAGAMVTTLRAQLRK